MKQQNQNEAENLGTTANFLPSGEASCSPSWIAWTYGWGWNLTLQPGIVITVSKGLCRTGGFRWSALGLMGKKHYAEPDDAKNEAIESVRRILTVCLDSLPNVERTHEENNA